ncbi:hypothetical protein [Tateyamaria sp.]|uniref:hypothetical protein n=1 Tax=Tateyamaria sp. TaxID=1929288 RepID=UPI003B210379
MAFIGVDLHTNSFTICRLHDDGTEGFERLCCTNQLRDSLYESSVVAGGYEQLVPYEVQDQELAFVQHGAKAARFAINLV